MGGIQSHRVGFEALRDSIPGALVPEQDFELFYSKCKIETARTFSNVVYPSHSQLFFVVVSGEVCVQLCSFDSKENKNTVVTAATYTAGEMIHFFCAPTVCTPPSNFEMNEFGECLCNGNIKLALHFNSNKGTGRVIGMDQRSFDEFKVSANGNLHNLTSFLELNIASIVKTANSFKSMTAQQMYMYGLLLKVQLHSAGKIVELKGRTPRSKKNPDAPDPPDCTPSPVGCTALFIHGNGFSVPNSINIQSLANKIASADTWTSPTNMSRKQAKAVGFVFRAPPVLSAGGPGSPSILDFFDMPKPTPSAERDNSARGKKMVTVTEGTVVGSDTYFTRKCSVEFRNYVTTSASVVGYIANDSIEALFEADPRFKRVFSRNYFNIVLSWIKYNVPFIMDMDEWSLALLSCKITLRGCQTDSIVKRKGDPSNYAYIVLGGSCKEVSESAEHSVESERVIGWGGIVGEVCLTTNTPYFHTVVAREPTLLLALGKRVLDQIYYNNKAKLCEIRIRMMGVDVDLLHAIDHPIGSKLFNDFLTRQLAQENLAFYIAVERFDSMCKNLSKLYLQLLKMRARALQADNGVITPAPVVSVTTSIIPTYDSTQNTQNNSPKSELKTQDENNAMSAELDKPKVFPIKVKPSNNSSSGLTNPASMVFNSHRIAIQELESDEELVAEESVRRNILRSNKGNIHDTENTTMAIHDTTIHTTNDAVVGNGLTLDVSTPTPVLTTGLNTSGLNTGTSGYSSKLSAGISDLGAYGLNTTNTSSSNIHNSSMQNSSMQSMLNLKVELNTMNTIDMLDPDTIAASLGAGAIDQVISPTDSTTKKRLHRSSFIREKIESAQASHTQGSTPKHLYIDTSTPEGDTLATIIYDNNHHQTNNQANQVPSTQAMVINTKMTPTSRALRDKPTSPTSIEENTQLLQAIECNTHKVTKNILELQLVAKHIMETYIFEGTCKQINLPGVMRLRAEKNFQRWTESIASGKLATTVEFKVPLAQTTHSSHENSFTFLSTPQNESADVVTGVNSDAEVGKGQEIATNATHTPPAINDASGNTIVPNNNNTNNINTIDPNTNNSAGSLHHPTTTNNNIINAGVHTDTGNSVNKTDSVDPEAAVHAFVRNLSVQNMQFSAASRTVSRLAPTSVPKELNGNTSPTIAENDDEANAPYKTESKPIYRSIFEVPAINPPPYNDEALRRLNSGSSEVVSPVAASVKVTTAGTPLNSTSAKNTTTNNTSNTSNALNTLNTLNNTPTTPTLVSVEGIDMSFIDLFAESKAEILKLLRDDKFPRWKQTAEFQSFIHNVKPYDKDREHSRYNNIQSQNSSDKDRSIDSRSYRSKL